MCELQTYVVVQKEGNNKWHSEVLKFAIKEEKSSVVDIVLKKLFASSETSLIVSLYLVHKEVNPLSLS